MTKGYLDKRIARAGESCFSPIFVVDFWGDGREFNVGKTYILKGRLFVEVSEKYPQKSLEQFLKDGEEFKNKENTEILCFNADDRKVKEFVAKPSVIKSCDNPFEDRDLIIIACKE